MKRNLTTAMAALALISAAPAAGDPAAGDVQRMQGDWMVATMRVNGEELPPQEAQALFRTVAGTQYSVSRYSRVISQGTFKIDATKSPKTIDSSPASAASQGVTILGIFEFDGRLLKICNAPPGKPRPANFDAGPGSTHTLIVWEPEAT